MDSTNETVAELRHARVAFDALNARVVELLGVWNVYTALYDSEAHIVEFNRSTGFAFGFLQRLLIHELIRIIYALSDREQFGRGTSARDNLSVAGVFHRLPTPSAGKPDEYSLRHNQLAPSITSNLSELAGTVRSLQAKRNRELMHFDQATLVGAENSPKLLRGDVNRCIASIRNAAEALGELITGTSYSYAAVGTAGVSEQLLRCVRDSNRLRDLRAAARNGLEGDSLHEAVVSPWYKIPAPDQ